MARVIQFPFDIVPFCTYLRARDRAVRTVQNYVSDLHQFVRWYEQTHGQPFAPAELNAPDVRDYRRHLLLRKAAPATINRALAALHVFAGWVVETGALATNPLLAIRGVDEQPRAPRWLEARDQSRLESALDLAFNGARTEPAKRQATRDRAWLMLLLYAGLRVSELCALDVDDVQISPRKGHVVVRAGKGARRRTVPLNAPVRAALSAWLDIRPADADGASRDAAAALFVNKRGERLHTSGVQRLLTMYGRRAGVVVTPHICRHSFAKRLVDSGTPIEQVAALLGHESLNTTRIYTMPSERDLERAVERLGE